MTHLCLSTQLFILALWPVMSVFINCFPLQKSFSPKLKAVKFMDISVYIFNLVWWHDHLVTRHLLLPAHDPSGHGQLTRFTVVDMESLPWNRPHVQSESSWLAHNFHATIVPVDALLHRVPMGQCCRIQCLVLGKIIMMSFLLPSACITM